MFKSENLFFYIIKEPTHTICPNLMEKIEADRNVEDNRVLA